MESNKWGFVERDSQFRNQSHCNEIWCECVHKGTKRNKEKIETLIAQGAQPHQLDDEGRLPLMEVLLSLNLEAVKYLDKALGVYRESHWGQIELGELERQLKDMSPSKLNRSSGTSTNKLG